MKETNTDRFVGIIAALILVNAILTVAHYIPILAGIVKVSTDLATVMNYTITDTISIGISSVVAAIGLWKRKSWGYAAALVAAGAYLHGILLLVVDSIQKSSYNVMNIVSLYFILFMAWSAVYLWRHRQVFS